MERKNYVIGAILITAMLFVIGLAGCDNGTTSNSGGNFVITGLTALNGKYIFAIEDNQGDGLLACASASESATSFSIKLAKVSNGKATLRVYDEDGVRYVGYDQNVKFIIIPEVSSGSRVLM